MYVDGMYVHVWQCVCVGEFAPGWARATRPALMYVDGMYVHVWQCVFVDVCVDVCPFVGEFASVCACGVCVFAYARGRVSTCVWMHVGACCQ
jgi:hypothetical protein